MEDLHLISDNGIATCLDSGTGRVIWTVRLPGEYSASPVLAGGRIYFCNQAGLTTVLASGPAFSALASNKLDGAFMASPAIAGQALLLRTKTHLYRIEQ